MNHKYYISFGCLYTKVGDTTYIWEPHSSKWCVSSRDLGMTEGPLSEGSATAKLCYEKCYWRSAVHIAFIERPPETITEELLMTWCEYTTMMHNFMNMTKAPNGKLIVSLEVSAISNNLCNVCIRYE